MNEELRDSKSKIAERSFHFSLLILKLYQKLEGDSIGRILGKQMLRSGTSIGANVHEAQGGQSKADFISKMSIAYKEARETVYWLRLIQATELISPAQISELADESSQSTKILSSILLTSKKNQKQAANS